MPSHRGLARLAVGLWLAGGLWLSAAATARAAGPATPLDVPGLTLLGTASAESLLESFKTIYNTDRVNPPFQLGTTGYVVRTTQPFVGIRSYISPKDSSDKAGQSGGWLMSIAEMRGLTRAQLLDRWALPIYGDGTRNNRVTLVVIPAGVSFWSGIAGPIPNAVDGTGDWGRGGGVQYYVGWGAAGVRSYQVPLANYTVAGSADPGPILVYGPRLTGAAQAVGAYLDRLPVPAYSDLDRALLTFDVLNLANPADAAPLQAAIRQLSPERYGALPQVLDHQRTVFLDALGERRDGLHPAPTERERETGSGTTLWSRALATSARLDSAEEVTGYRSTSWAGMAGADRRIDDDFMLGVGGAYLTSRLEWQDAGSSKGSVETAMLGVYGAYTPGRVFLNGQLAGGMSWGEIDRRIAVADSGLLPGLSTAMDRTAKGKPRAAAASARLDAGVRIAGAGVQFRPFVGLHYAFVDRPGFAEHGADALDLTVAGWSGHSLRSRLGLAASYELATTGPVAWSLDGRLLWSQRLSASSTDLSAGLSGQPGSFTVSAAGEPSYAIQPALGLSGRFAGGELSLRAQGEVRRDYHARAIVAGLALSF
jgi:outer membrane autotransporter protein